MESAYFIFDAFEVYACLPSDRSIYHPHQRCAEVYRSDTSLIDRSDEAAQVRNGTASYIQ